MIFILFNFFSVMELAQEILKFEKMREKKYISIKHVYVKKVVCFLFGCYKHNANADAYAFNNRLYTVCRTLCMVTMHSGIVHTENNTNE